MIGTQAQVSIQVLLLELLKRFGLAGLEELEKDGGPYQDSFVHAEVQRSLTKEQLQALPSRGAPLLRDQCILLPHFRKDTTFWLPVLWLRLANASSISIQMVVLGGERRFGFRWESPESGAEGIGDHDFWHLQPICSIRMSDGNERSLDLQHQHICSHFPTIPVDALNAVQLLDAMMVSLYGPKYASAMIDDAGVRNQLHVCSRDRQWARARSASSQRGGSKLPKLPRKRSKGKKR